MLGIDIVMNNLGQGQGGIMLGDEFPTLSPPFQESIIPVRFYIPPPPTPHEVQLPTTFEASTFWCINTRWFHPWGQNLESKPRDRWWSDRLALSQLIGQDHNFELFNCLQMKSKLLPKAGTLDIQVMLLLGMIWIAQLVCMAFSEKKNNLGPCSKELAIFRFHKRKQQSGEGR